MPGRNKTMSSVVGSITELDHVHNVLGPSEHYGNAQSPLVDYTVTIERHALSPLSPRSDAITPTTRAAGHSFPKTAMSAPTSPLSRKPSKHDSSLDSNLEDVKHIIVKKRMAIYNKEDARKEEDTVLGMRESLSKSSSSSSSPKHKKKSLKRRKPHLPLSQFIDLHVKVLSALSISMKYFRRVDDLYAVYGLEVSLADRKNWVVERRYSDFVILHREVYSCLKAIVTEGEFDLLPPLPHKTYWFKRDLSSEFLAARGKALNLFINDLLSLLCSVLPDLKDATNVILAFRAVFILSRFLGINIKDETTFKLKTVSMDRILEQFSHFSEILDN